MPWLRLLLLVLLESLLALSAAASEPVPEDDRVVGWLRQYLQIDTTNPPGNEAVAVEFLGDLLEAEGISSQVLTSPTGRASLYARLQAPGSAGDALILMHHIDVVPAEDRWRHPPFSGREAEGKIWGRGALDTKGLGIAQLAAILALHRDGGPMRHDVIYLAVADEETGGREGAGWLLDAHPELFADVGAVLNEGGANRVLNDRLIWWGIEVIQKRPLWLRATASGRGGHGSRLNVHSATHRLVKALARLVERPPEMRANSAALMYLGALARLEGGRSAELHARLEAGGDFSTLPMGPGLPVYFLDTVQVTEINNGRGANVVAAEAQASIDIRLLPDTDGDAFLAEVRQILGEDIEVEVMLSAPEVAASPQDHPLWKALEEALGVRAPVVPTFIPGTTDSRYFRQRGIPAYGFSPFALNPPDLRGIHARDESIPAEALLRGTKVLLRILRAYAGSSG